jgi:predicted dehydrogenase
MKAPIGVCLVGAGFWAEEMHLPTFARIPGVEVVSVVATSTESARRVADRHGIQAWSTDLYEAVADPRVDVVDIVAPNDVHAPAVIAAAQAGKHAICIKPLARSLVEADAMLDAVRAAGTRLFYAENVPFIPAVQEARRLVDIGQIGDVYRVKACEGIPGPHADWFFDRERTGGGAIIDMSVHSIAFCEFMAGSSVRSVYADADTYVWPTRTQAEDTAVLTLRFANGALGQCEDSWGLTGAMDSRFEVFGTTGRIMIDNLYRQPIQVVSDAGSPGNRSGWSFPLPVPGYIADGHMSMLDHFIDCIRNDLPSTLDGLFGRHMLAVVDAAVRSVQTGQRIELADTTTEAPMSSEGSRR